VIVPYVAFSAATILALGADEIVMHPYSNLGPVDPQLHFYKQSPSGNVQQIQSSTEDFRNYLEFVRTDTGITDQNFLASALSSLTEEVGALIIGSAKRNQQLSLSLSSKMLQTHLKDQHLADNIAKTLNSSYYHHAYAVGRKEAKELGLKIVNPEPEIEGLMWKIWLDFCEDMKCEQPFDPILEIMADPSAKQFLTNSLTQNNAGTFHEIRLSLLNASVESIRRASVNNSTVIIFYWRNPDLSLNSNISQFSIGWTDL
jgi:hypothetical protein